MVRRKHSEHEADTLRDGMGIAEPPDDVVSIAAALFLQIAEKQPWLWNSRSLLRRDTGEIWVNAGESRRGRRFSIGHEIGHFVLHPDVEVFTQHADPASAEYSSDPDKELEREADYFGSVLLVPPTWLAKDVDAGMTTDELARRYDVSAEVVFIALDQHRLLSRIRVPRQP